MSQLVTASPLLRFGKSEFSGKELDFTENQNKKIRETKIKCLFHNKINKVVVELVRNSACKILRIVVPIKTFKNILFLFLLLFII